MKDVARVSENIFFGDASPLNSHDFLFMHHEEALKELTRRRDDARLQEATQKSLAQHGNFILKHFERPRAVLFRQVATPTHETLRFLRYAKDMDLEPLVLEYYGDKFVSARNPYKRSLGKMPIYQHVGADGQVSIRYNTVLDFPAYEGKSFYNVRCIHGEPLIAYHHRLLAATTGMDVERSCVDATPWFGLIGLQAEKYYEQVFTLFVRDGILFENYFVTPSERSFVEHVIIPAFNAVSRTYGVQPIIVRLLPPKQELQTFWDSYPKKIERFLDAS